MKLKGKQFSKILVAIDGSEESMKAVEYAISIAKRHNSELIGLSVIDISKPRHITSTFITAPTYGVERFEEDKKAAQELLDRIKSDCHKEGMELGTKIVEGSTSVEAAIVDYAEREDINLIVIGTRGRTGFKKLLLGSVALGVITYSHCPVIVVK